MTDVGKDRHRLGLFLRTLASSSSFFFLSTPRRAFLRRACQPRITYQLIAFFNIPDKRLKLSFPNTVIRGVIMERVSRYIYIYK